jgi:hypothetical protein
MHLALQLFQGLGGHEENLLLPGKDAVMILHRLYLDIFPIVHAAYTLMG